MWSTTALYLELSRLYRAKADADAAAVQLHVAARLRAVDRPPDAISAETVRSFVRQAGSLRCAPPQDPSQLSSQSGWGRQAGCQGPAVRLERRLPCAICMACDTRGTGAGCVDARQPVSQSHSLAQVGHVADIPEPRAVYHRTGPGIRSAADVLLACVTACAVCTAHSGMCVLVVRAWQPPSDGA